MDSDSEPDLVMWKWIIIFLVVVVSSIALYIPRINPNWFFVKEGISKGNWLLSAILVSNAVIQMLPESERAPPLLDGGADGISFPLQHGLFLLGFVLTMLIQTSIECVKTIKTKLENASVIYALDSANLELSTVYWQVIENDDEEKSNKYKKIIEREDVSEQEQIMGPLTLAVITSLDTILTGIALATEDRSAGVVVLGMSMLASDWLESVLFGISLTANRETAKSKKKFYIYSASYIAFSALIPAICVIVISLLNHGLTLEIITGIVKSILAGSFMYMGCIELLAREIFKTMAGTPGTVLKTMAINTLVFSIGCCIVSGIVYVESLK